MDVDSATKFDALLTVALRTSWNTGVDLRDTFFTSLTSVRAKASGGDGKSTVTIGAPLQRVAAKDLSSVVEKGIMMYEREERDLGIHIFPEMLSRLVAADRYALECLVREEDATPSWRFLAVEQRML